MNHEDTKDTKRSKSDKMVLAVRGPSQQVCVSETASTIKGTQNHIPFFFVSFASSWFNRSLDIAAKEMGATHG